MSVRQLLDGNGKISSVYLPTFIENDLASPVGIKGGAPGTAGNAVIRVNGDGESEYGGSITLNPGANDVSEVAQVGVNIKSTPTGCSVEVGTNGPTGPTGPYVENYLYIAGRYGLSEVNDMVYNPVQPFVNYGANVSVSTPEPINNASLYNSIRTIPLGATPATYNYFQVFLDIDTTLAYSEAEPLIRIYLTDTENGEFNETKSIVNWVQAEVQPTGQRINEQDIPLVFFGVPSGNNLYVNITFANSPVPADINANFSATTTDFSVVATKVSSM
jgi:hypothetical protein